MKKLSVLFLLLVFRLFVCCAYLVGNVFEAHAGSVESSSLFSVSNPETNVIKSVKYAKFGADGGLFVINHMEIKCLIS